MPNPEYSAYHSGDRLVCKLRYLSSKYSAFNSAKFSKVLLTTVDPHPTTSRACGPSSSHSTYRASSAGHAVCRDGG